LQVWVPHLSHAELLLGKQITELENFLQKRLNLPNLRIKVAVKPEAFPEIQTFQTSEERWAALRQKNPLAEELRRLAKGQVLPREVERYLHSNQKPSTDEKE